MCSPLWSILVCKTHQFLTKKYRFGQLIIFLKLFKIYIMFSPPTGPKYPFFYRIQLMDYNAFFSVIVDPFSQLCCVDCHTFLDNFPFIFSLKLPHFSGVPVKQGSCNVFFTLFPSGHSTSILSFVSLLIHTLMLCRLRYSISFFTFHSFFSVELFYFSYTAQKIKFSIKDFLSLRILSHLLKKSLMENFIFLCSVV